MSAVRFAAAFFFLACCGCVGYGLYAADEYKIQVTVGTASSKVEYGVIRQCTTVTVGTATSKTCQKAFNYTYIQDSTCSGGTVRKAKDIKTRIQAVAACGIICGAFALLGFVLSLPPGGALRLVAVIFGFLSFGAGTSAVGVFWQTFHSKWITCGADLCGGASGCKAGFGTGGIIFFAGACCALLGFVCAIVAMVTTSDEPTKTEPTAATAAGTAAGAGAASGPAKAEPAPAAQEPAEEVPAAEGEDDAADDWVLDEESGMWWSNKQGLYLHQESGHFYDPNTGWWCDPEGNWYRDPDAEG